VICLIHTLTALPRTPDWKVSLRYQRDVELPFGVLKLSGLATFSDEYYLGIYNRDELAAGVFPGLPNGGNGLAVQQSYASYDLSAYYENKARTWGLQAYIKNVTDENVKLSSGDFITENGFTANYLPPRTYGLIFSLSL